MCLEHEETCLWSLPATNILESIISKLATIGILIFYLVSVAEQAGLSMTFWETPKTSFSHVVAHM